MEFEQLKSKYTERFEGLLPVLTEVLKQIYRKDFTVEIEISEKTELSPLISEEEFPRVYAKFSILGDTNYQHFLSFSETDVMKLFAWMIDAEIDESLTDDHLEGLKEGANQIFGQLQAALDGDGISFTVEGLDITKVESPDAILSDLPDETGLGVACVIKSDSETFKVWNYMWTSSKTEGAVLNEDNDTDSILSDGSSEKGSVKDVETILDDSFPKDDAAFAEISEDELVNVHPAEFESFDDNSNNNGRTRNIDMLLDVELEAVVVLGEKRMLIREILKLGNGSIVELDKAAGEPLEILINGKKLAEGEVVVVDDHFGIRITALVGPKERIRSLG